MRTILIFLAIFLLYVLRLLSLPRLDLKDGQLVRVTGVLVQEPEISGNKQKFNLGQFEIWTERYPEYHYGDKVELVGRIKTQLSAIQNPLTSSINSIISFKSYLLNFPEIKSRACLTDGSVCRQAGITGTGIAVKLKERLLSFYQGALPAPFDGILSGIVLGDKSMISYDFWEKLRLTGTLHIMVASGMNVAFIAGSSLSILCLFFKRKPAIIVLVFLICFYCLMTGLSASVLRAGIMIGLLYLSQIIGREVSGARVLLLTGAIMVLASPLLVFDVGFQLSFLATAGLVFLQPTLKNGLEMGNGKWEAGSRSGRWDILESHFSSRFPASYLYLPTSNLSKLKRLLIKVVSGDNFTSTLSAQIFTLPIMVGSFGQLNILSPIINLAVLWAVPFILQIGIVVGIISLIFEKLAILLSYLVFPLLFYINQVINVTAKIEFSQVFLPKNGLILSLLYYLIIGFLLKKRTSQKT